jgi:hypothetical protein
MSAYGSSCRPRRSTDSVGATVPSTDNREIQGELRQALGRDAAYVPASR